jgi:hypothetical protein
VKVEKRGKEASETNTEIHEVTVARNGAQPAAQKIDLYEALGHGPE